MKLLFLIDNGKTIGGGDYAQFKFAEMLAKRGHEVMVFAANYNRFMDDMQSLPGLDIKIRNELPRMFKGIGRLNSIYDDIYFRMVIMPYVKKNSKNIDFIIGYLRRSAIKAVMLGKKYGIRTANFIFENPEWMERVLGSRFMEEYRGKFRSSWEKAKEAYMQTDILIPNSKLTGKECSRWLSRDVSEPVYPGVEVIESEEKETGQLIYVGRLNNLKNVDIIIMALSKLKKRPKLVLVGTGEEEKSLRNLASMLGVAVEFKGSLNDTEKFREIKKSSAMIFPSSFEGFGMPPAEALALGRICICSDIPVLKEIYGKNVVYFKENDPEDLAKKIIYVLKNRKLMKAKAEKGKSYVLKRYTWERAAEKIEKIFKG